MLRVRRGDDYLLFVIKRDSGFCFCFPNHFLLSFPEGYTSAHLHLKNTSLPKIILSQEHRGYRVLDT